ncbi:MAG: energy transducer TonB [Prevotella sp.]|nr:energy transducer TonB [Prevotella sp.]
MKKILAIILVSVCTVSVSFAQNKHPRAKMMPRFEMLDSASKANFLKARASWGKRVKDNEKRWQKHMAWGAPRMGFGKMTFRGFKFEPQEQMPEFVGGEDALKDWLYENITYPIAADEISAEGKVVVTFDVNNDGTIGNVKVKESVNPILDEEVVSKLEEMPDWIPARQNGRTVKVKYTLPITFTKLS